MTIGTGQEIPGRSLEGLDTQGLAARLRIATLAARGVAEDELFAAAAEEAAKVAGAEASGVLRFLGEQRAVIVGAWRAPGVRGLPVNAEVDFDSANSALGRAWSTRRPARVDTYDGARGELPRVMQAVGLRASLAAPVLIHADVWGALVVSTTRDEPLATDAEHRVGYLADLVACGVAAAEARAELAASRLRIVEAADEARRRLDHTLHEGHHQHLLALALKLRVARDHAAEGSELAEMLEDAVAQAADANSSLRALAREIYPAVLSERGLAAALQALAARAAVPVHLSELPRGRFPAVTETTAYFVIAEALRNASKHAHAAEVAVRVADRGDRLIAELRHDGNEAPGSVLAALADRAAAVGGHLDVDSRPGCGTVVRFEAPLAR
jgi:signal transduction histidine kinase